MADKTKSTRNSERDSGKAWGKNHNVVRVKPTQSAEKVARREARPLGINGAKVTMPNISWEWATRAMVTQRTTRKSASVDAYFEHMKGKPGHKADDSVPMAKSGR